ncbi:MAG: penicillin-binding protein 2 [Actinomycetota bacterium]|nr:penicillin-binding protein 2 [Actinomycetota bacterium]
MGNVQSRKKEERRILLLLGIIIIGLLGIATRLIFIQGVEAKKYDTLALKQRLRRIELAPHRGTIYDRDGQELAVSVQRETIYATPYLIKKPLHVASKLSPILDVNEEILYKKLTRDCGFVYLARKVDQEKAEAVRALEIEGIGFLKENKRYYPCNSVAAQVVGFVGVDNKGLTGLELYYDDLLRGRPGELIVEKDPCGRAIPGGILQLLPPTDGNSITLTLDRDIQFKTEETLKKGVEKFHAKSGLAIVMNPKTGEIYAMANYPSFDLNNFSKTSSEVIRNRAVTDIYEPGSTVKAIIASAALEERLFTPKNIFYLPSTIKVSNKVIKEAHPRPPRNFTFTQIITESSNVGVVTIGLKLGREKIYEYLSAFGLTEKSRIDFPGESKGYVPPPDKWYGTTIANIPFGQGLSATPLQMIQAISIIANDGLKVRPHLLSSIISPQGKVVKTFSRDSGEKVLSSKTTRQMRDILEQAVDMGTGKTARIPGYRVAGKTGTAQKVKKYNRGYESGKYIASFVGFVPAQDPQLIILVVIDEPQDAIWGSVAAAPIFKEIAEFSLRHLRIAP